ncbi:MAG: MBL fold metallo-hydrolase [Actinomycetota bacterium]|nr:MBL fold metallo-hydrolase [Actinomycetota bacterium]
MKIFDHFEVGPLACNCYVVGDPESRRAIVIDPGGDAEVLARSLRSHHLNVTAIVATHAHFDHLLAAESLRQLTGAPFYMHDADKPLLDWYQESGRMFLGLDLGPPPEIDTPALEGDLVVAGAVALEVIHTPGHSPGSITLASDDVLFSGDTLFAGSIGRSDLPGGDTRQLLGVIKEKLFSFEDEVPVYPGHGPATTVGAERRSNPFVGERSDLWLPPQ